MCDPAVGSGAILVAACRYLADRLQEAWAAEGTADAYDPEMLPLEARRRIVERCLYAVDRDPMAVEMAKLSLWLVTMAKDRPFTFVDHAIRTGDSLLGITTLEQLRAFHLDPDRGYKKVELGVDWSSIDRVVKEAIDLRRRLTAIPVLTVRDAELKATLAAEADGLLSTLTLIADVIIGAALSTTKGAVKLDDRLAACQALVGLALDDDPATATLARTELTARARQWLDAGKPAGSPNRHPLHWALAFPEVFADGERFDAMVGNPPFLGGQRLTGAAGTDFREYAIRWIAGGVKGSADLVAYFFLRTAQVSQAFGLIATNTIAQGDTREVGLDQLSAEGWTIHQANKTRPWPGEANLEVAQVWAVREPWAGSFKLEDTDVSGITPSLDRPGRASGNPRRITSNASKSFQGSIILGLGFTMPAREAERLIEKDPRNADVLFPYLNGKDLNDSPTQAASRWVINFFDWPQSKAREYADCYAIVEERVKPERDKVNRPARRQRWWQFAETAVELYRTIDGLKTVLVLARVSKVVQPALLATGKVMADVCVVFAYDDDFHFGLLSSAFHWWWAVTYASTMRTDLRYTPSDVFETFAQPDPDDAVADVGKRLHEHRAALMISNDQGLTKTYNRVHNPEDDTPGIVILRDLHVELDHAVAAAYGWSDLALDHQFWDTPQGRRYTVSPAAKDELLDRLLELNHARYAEEVARGLHATKGKAKKAARPGTPAELFP